MKATLKEIDDREFADQLTEQYGMVTVCGMEYESGRALQELDPTAFRCAMADEPEVWACECGYEYETEDEANECCLEE